jgi:hypothetical protein
MILLLYYRRSHPILAVAMIHHNLQQVRINPKYERYSTRLTCHKLEIKCHQEVCKALYKWGLLDTFCIKA